MRALGPSSSDPKITTPDATRLTIAPGEVHAIMGPIGSGKSTLSDVLAGAIGTKSGNNHINGAALFPDSEIYKLLLIIGWDEDR